VRTRRSGAVRIFLYNWPVYVATWGVALAAAICSPLLPSPLRTVTLLAATGAALWSAVSLVVSSYIYDHSPLAGGAWVPALVGHSARSWAAIHAGLDAEIDLGPLGSDNCQARLDIFDPNVMRAPSIHRARRTTAPTSPSTPSKPTALALDDGSCDAIVVAFSAHEIRDARARERFFDEIRRCLRPGARVLVVEHLRDLANFLAFGPGFLHFLPRREWRRLAAHARFVVADERRITPWVMALTLERPA